MNLLIALLVFLGFYFLIIKPFLIPSFLEGLRGQSNNQKRKFLKKQNYSETAEEKGRRFEEFVAKNFDYKYFRLKEWRSDKFIDGIYPDSNFYPDLELEFKMNDQVWRFAIECKYRTSLNENQIEFAEDRKMENYRRYEKEKNIPVYIVLGRGGNSFNPNELFLIPLKRIQGNSISYEELKRHLRNTDKKFYYNIETKSLS